MNNLKYKFKPKFIRVYVQQVLHFIYCDKIIMLHNIYYFMHGGEIIYTDSRKNIKKIELRKEDQL